MISENCERSSWWMNDKKFFFWSDKSSFTDGFIAEENQKNQPE